MAKKRRIRKAKPRSSVNSAMLGNKVTVTAQPERPKRRKRSPAQLLNSERFDEAASYGARCMEIPERKAMYAKRITKRKSNAYTVACSDYLNPPKIHYIKIDDNGPTGIISIKATDDFAVTSVKVTITDTAGNVLEEGSAVQHRLKRQMWKYETKVAGKNSKGTVIKVVAWDHPRNETEGELVIE